MTLAAILLALAIFGTLAWSWARLLGRFLADDGRLRLNEMLRRQGVNAEPAVYPAALAARRCVLCAEKKHCDRWLASGAHAGYERFCPNSAFVQDLTAVKPSG
jgi:hypothetical protein